MCCLFCAKFNWNLEIWRFNDLKYGDSAACVILNLLNLEFMAHMSIVMLLLPCAKFHWNRTISCRVMIKKRFWKWRPLPSWILKIVIFGYVIVIEFQIGICTPKCHQNQTIFRQTLLRYVHFVRRWTYVRSPCERPFRKVEPSG